MKEVWEKQYDKNKPPWNYDDFDEDFRGFLKSKFYKDFTVIDLGCGNGSQAWHIEKLSKKDLFHPSHSPIYIYVSHFTNSQIH